MIRQPDAFLDISIGLGLLRDRSAVGTLIEYLKNARTTHVYAAVARDLDFIGDGRTVDPLIEVMRNTKLTGKARSYAIVALGLVGNKEDLLFNATLSANITTAWPSPP